MSKKLNTSIQYKYDTLDRWESSEYTPLEGELLVYSEGEQTKIKVGHGDASIGDLPYVTFDGQQDSKILSYPTQANVLTYQTTFDAAVSGDHYYTPVEQYPIWNGRTDKMIISEISTLSEWHAGEYHVYFTPIEGYTWEDGTRTEYETTWKIEKSSNLKIKGLPSETESVILNMENNYWKKIPIYFDDDSEKVIMSVVSSDESVVDASYHVITSQYYELVLNGSLRGSVTVTVQLSAASDSNYVGTYSYSFTVTSDLQNLESYSWAEIKDICDDPNTDASTMFELGDLKTAGVNGEKAILVHRAPNFLVFQCFGETVEVNGEKYNQVISTATVQNLNSSWYHNNNILSDFWNNRLINDIKDNSVAIEIPVVSYKGAGLPVFDSTHDGDRIEDPNNPDSTIIPVINETGSSNDNECEKYEPKGERLTLPSATNILGTDYDYAATGFSLLSVSSIDGYAGRSYAPENGSQESYQFEWYREGNRIDSELLQLTRSFAGVESTIVYDENGQEIEDNSYDFYIGIKNKTIELRESLQRSAVAPIFVVGTLS